MATKPANKIENVTDIAAKRPAKTGTMTSGLTFKKAKSVTVPVLKLMPDVPVYIRAEQKMEMSKQIATKKVGDKPMDPATIMHVTDLDSDNENILIVGKVLEGVINDTYPDHSYVGKCFEIINHGKRGDKKYNTYSVTEIELED